MGNGNAACGGTTAEFNAGANEWRTGTIYVTSEWSSSNTWVELACQPYDGERFCISLDRQRDSDAATELAVALLEAIDQQEMADQLRAQSSALKEKAEIRERASDVAYAAQKKAQATFLRATSDQRAAYNDAVTAAEKAYQDATGEQMIMRQSIDIRKVPQSTITADVPF
jgi:hypothetical protein